MYMMTNITRLSLTLAGSHCIDLTINNTDITQVDALLGSSIVVTCLPGFTVDNADGVRFEVPCLQNGEWSTWRPCTS